MEQVIARLAKRLKKNPESVGVTGYKFRVCPPAPKKAVVNTEKRLGFGLPPMLRRIYLEIANGGFGPGYGVMGVEGGFTDDLGHTIADLFESYRRIDPEDPAWIWPKTFLPICHWGCVVYSAVDCWHEPYPVYFVDVSMKEPGEPMESIIKLHKPSIEAWVCDWLDGKNLWAEGWA